MASTSLFLKDKKSTSKTRVICQLTDGRNVKLRLSTGVSVLVKNWSERNSNVKSTDNEAVSKNIQLKDFKSKVLSIYNECVLNGKIPTLEFIQHELTPKEIVNTNKIDFWETWDLFMEDKKITLAKGTLRYLNSFKKHLEAFELSVLKLNKKSSSTGFYFDTINARVLNKFQDYLYKTASLNTQTTAKHIKTFKMFLNWCFENKFTTAIDYKSFSPKHQPDQLKIILTKEDIEKIKKTDVTGKAYLNNVRELLILSTLTGFRYSDYAEIKPEHIRVAENGLKSIMKVTTKTDAIVDVPLIPESEEIVNKILKGEVYAISNQKMNKYLKELCQLAGIDDKIEVIEYKGTLKVFKSMPKYSLISSHTGRRSYATHLILKNVPMDIIMQYTGHKDLRSFAKYVNIPKETNKEITRNALLG